MDNLYYAVKNKNDLIREESASGGFFSIIAEYVLNKVEEYIANIKEEKFS